MIDPVTIGSLDSYLAKYADARGGELNEDTESEATFLLTGKFFGVYALHSGVGIYWIGLQNASSRITQDGHGKSYVTIRDALMFALNRQPRDVFYSDKASERWRWLADRVDEFYSSGDFLLIGSAKSTGDDHG